MIRNRWTLLFAGIAAVILILAFIPWDTDDSVAALEKRGKGFSSEPSRPCLTDGIGLSNVPFGVTVQMCDVTWFLLFNHFPFQIKK
jgi:hypothetical protein